MTTTTAQPRPTDARSHTQTRLRAELARANAVLVNAKAVRTEPDGFSWIDEIKLPADFVSYYTGLVATCYAYGAI
jgi:hypothetical protein